MAFVSSLALSRSPHPSQGLRLSRDGAKALEAIGAAASMKAKCDCDSGDFEVIRQRGFIGHSSASAVPNVCLCDRRTFVLFPRRVQRQPKRVDCAAKTILRGDITSITFKNRPRDRKAKAGSLWLSLRTHRRCFPVCRLDLHRVHHQVHDHLPQMDGVAPHWQHVRRTCPASVGPVIGAITNSRARALWGR